MALSPRPQIRFRAAPTRRQTNPSPIDTPPREKANRQDARAREGPTPQVYRADRHLMLQPMLGRWSEEGGWPSAMAAIAARRSRPVTGLPLEGRLSSNWPW